MPLQIVRHDITRITADAIVNSTNPGLRPSGVGVDASIHAAAGRELAQDLAEIGFCDIGSSVITKSYGLDTCKYIIHAVPPRYEGGQSGEEALLRQCYLSVFSQALSHGCRSIAMPVLSAGAYRYPKNEAYKVATSCAREFLADTDSEIDIFLVIFSDDMFDISRKMKDSVTQYITENYRLENKEKLSDEDYRTRPDEFSYDYSSGSDLDIFLNEDIGEEFDDRGYEEYPKNSSDDDFDLSPVFSNRPKQSSRPSSNLLDLPLYDADEVKCDEYTEELASDLSAINALFADRDEYEDDYEEPSYVESPKTTQMPTYSKQDLSFGQMCVWWMDRKNMSVSEFYSRANITKSTFHNLKKHPEQTPKKTTAFACAVGLKLNIEEANDLLARAGIVMSPYYKTDVIVKCFIENSNYDIDEINLELYNNDQSILGSVAV